MKISVVLLALLLAAMAIVPCVSAGEQKSSALPIDNNSVNSARMSDISSKFVGYISPEKNVDMSKEEFRKVNADNINFLKKSFSESEVDQMVDAAYIKAIAQDTKTASTVSSKALNTIVQVGGYDIVLWPYTNTAQNVNEYSGSINLIFFGMTKSQVTNYMKNSAATKYTGGTGWQEFGIRGPSVNTMYWTSTAMMDQLQYGDYYGIRYHLILLEGDYSSSLGKNWCYGQTHKEYWSTINPGPGHFIYGNGFDQARSFFNQAMNGAKPWSSIDLNGDYPGYADGYAYTYRMA